MFEGIVSIFRKIEDPRKGNAIDYDLTEVLTIAILSVVCGAKTFVDMENFGKGRIDWLKRFLRLERGIPSHDTFGDIFAALNPEAVTEGFVKWVETIREKISGEIVPIDGKTVRASKDVPKNKKAVHIVSAWAAQNKLVLGQLACEEKSNEITAIPKLLELLELRGCIVTIDAMGTQTKIAEKIIEKGADYILTVKANQKKLHDNIKGIFDSNEAEAESFETAESNESNHGRVELRKVIISRDTETIDPEGLWPGLSGAAAYCTVRDNLSTGKIETSTQYLIFSMRNATATQILEGKRAHWGIENQLHWLLDVACNEDGCRARKGNSAVNHNIFRQLSLNLLQQEKSLKNGIAAKQFNCAISTDYLEKVLGVS